MEQNSMQTSCSCPHCGQNYDVPSTYSGQVMQCGTCGKDFMFQETSGQVESFPVQEYASNGTPPTTGKSAYHSNDSLKIVIEKAKAISDNNKRNSVQFQPGQMISHYEVKKCLGVGGMGEVYLVRDVNLGCLRALKTLKGNIEDSEEDKERFLREARIAAMIQHKSIVGVMEVVTAENSPEHITYIVMEYVDGGSVADILKKGPIREPEALRITIQAAEALKAAQKVQLVHRDIKPANIMMTSDGDVKIADFGIASGKTEEFEIGSTLTMAGTMMGTPAYAAPEQCRNSHNADVRSDIYSLGISLFEMLTGKLPYSGDNACDLMFHAANDPVPDPRSINPSISERTALLTMRMMAKKPADRPQDPEQLGLALSLALNQDRITSPELEKLFNRLVSEHDQQQVDTIRQAKTKKMILLIALLCILAAGVAYFFLYKYKDIRKEIQTDANIRNTQLKVDYTSALQKTFQSVVSARYERDELRELLEAAESQKDQNMENFQELSLQLSAAQEKTDKLEKELLQIKKKMDAIEPGFAEKTISSYKNMRPELTSREKKFLEEEVAKGVKFSPDGRTLLNFPRLAPIKNYAVPRFVREIGAHAFADCHLLESVTIPNGIETIGSHAFQSCISLENILLPDSMDSISWSAFMGCMKLKKITVPAGLKKIENQTFEGCSSLENVVIPEGVEEIKDRAFHSCKLLRTIQFPKSLTMIGRDAFHSCSSLTEIIFPPKLKAIDSGAFSRCNNLRKIEIPDKLETIGSMAFSHCSNLRYIKFPATVKLVAKDAFLGCSTKNETVKQTTPSVHLSAEPVKNIPSSVEAEQAEMEQKLLIAQSDGKKQSSREQDKDVSNWLPGPTDQWHIRLDTAMKAARKGHKKIFVLTTGSDWCGWCMKLHSEVLSSSDFTDFAKKKLALVYLDFPRSKRMPEFQKLYNQKLTQAIHSSQGVPAAFVFDEKGRMMGSIIGYKQLSQYIRSLQDILNSGTKNGKSFVLPDWVRKSPEQLIPMLNRMADEKKQAAERAVQITENVKKKISFQIVAWGLNEKKVDRPFDPQQEIRVPVRSNVYFMVMYSLPADTKSYISLNMQNSTISSPRSIHSGIGTVTGFLMCRYPCNQKKLQILMRLTPEGSPEFVAAELPCNVTWEATGSKAP